MKGQFSKYLDRKQNENEQPKEDEKMEKEKIE